MSMAVQCTLYMHSTVYSVVCGVYCILYIFSYRVTGLYRLSKTCYLHSLLCNNSIIAQFPVLNDIISICTWENDNTANSHATSNTGDVPLFAQKSCHEDAT